MTLAKPSKLPPHQPCFVVFNGSRHIRNALYERIHEPLQVVECVNGQCKELAVQMTGRSAKWPIGNFSGTWIVLELEGDE